MNDMVAQFKHEGYVKLTNRIDTTLLTSVELAIQDIFWHQAHKIKDYSILPCDMDAIINALEGRDNRALYQCQALIQQSPVVRGFITKKFTDLLCTFFDGNPASTLVSEPNLFVNAKNAKRLLTKYHTEALYYPKRRKFINVWFPIFTDRTAANGAMIILPQSHSRAWDASMMSEYQGYTKDDEGKKEHLTQYEIPTNMLEGYKPHVCEAARGDCYIFDRNLVHSSASNTTGKLSYALVFRVWDFKDDLTLSGDMGVVPYGGRDIGRCDLLVANKT